MSMLTRIDCVVICYLSLTNPNHKKNKIKIIIIIQKKKSR